MKILLEWLAKKVGFFGVILAPILAGIAAVAAFMTQVIAGIGTINDALIDMLPSINGGIASLSPWFVKANTFFPVTEAFVLVGALATLRTICAVIRMTKAFIFGS